MVAVGPASALTLEPDIKLIKPALLYGDKVKLYSPLANMLASVAALGGAEGEDRIKAILKLMEAVGETVPPEAAAAMRGLQAIQKLPRAQRRKLLRGRTGKEAQEFAHKLEDAWRPLQEKVDEMLIEAGADELEKPLTLGLLDVEPLFDESGNLDTVIETFATRLGEVLADGHSYPLFDDTSGGLARAGIAEGLFEMSTSSTARGKQVTAASELLSYLPAFPLASVAEILDIREALRRPLVAFRGAMVEVATLIDSPATDERFRDEVLEIYRGTVAPAIEAIRDEVETNAYLRKLIGEAVKDLPKWLGAGILTLATTPSSQLPELIVAGAAAVEPAARAGWEHAQGKREIRAQQYYFLYETERLLA